MVTAMEYGNAGLPGAALLPVHYEAISQGAGGRGCSEGAGKREQGETTGDRCEKRRDQLSAEMRGYPLSGSDTERNKTASCDRELGCPYVTLRQMLLKMPKGMFAQCHRMYAVNKNEVEYYDTVNRIIRIKNCPDTVEIGVTYKSVIGGLLNG